MKLQLFYLILFKVTLCFIKTYIHNKRVNHICTTKSPNYICFICPTEDCDSVTVLYFDENGNVNQNYYSFNQIDTNTNLKFKIKEYKTNIIQISDNLWVGCVPIRVSGYALLKIILNEETKVFTPIIIFDFTSYTHFINTIILYDQTILFGHGKRYNVYVNITYFDYNNNQINFNPLFQSTLSSKNIINCVQFKINDEIGCFFDNDTKAYFVFLNNIDNIIPINILDGSEGIKYIKYDEDTIIICTTFLISDRMCKYACTFGYHEAGNFIIDNDFKTLFEVDKGKNSTSPIIIHNFDFLFSDNDKKILLVAAGQYDGIFIGKFLIDNNFELIGRSSFTKIQSNENKKILVRYILKHSDKFATVTFMDYYNNLSPMYLYTFPVCTNLIQYGEINNNLIFTPEQFNQDETFTEIGILTSDFDFIVTDTEGNTISFTTNTPYNLNDYSLSFTSSTLSKYSFTYYLQNTESPNDSLTSNICKGELIFCETNCGSCELGSSLCLTCKEGYSFKDEYNGICISVLDMPTNYYEDTSLSPIIWKKCDNLCSTCNKGPNSKSNNCITCINSYSLMDDFNCILTTSMPVGYYLNTSINKFISCNFNFNYCTKDSKCDKNYPLLVIDIGQCVQKCDSVDCDYCTSNILINIGNYCLNPTDNKDGSYNINAGNMDYNEVMKLIKEEYMNLNNFVSIIEVGDYDIMVYDTSKSNSELAKINSNNHLTNINLYECQTKLEKLFPTPLTIIKIDEKDSTSITSTCTYYVYDNDGNEIDINKYCLGIKISITSPIINIDSFDYGTAQQLSNYGYDVFDPNNDFFNNICTTYTNQNGTDVTLKDRQRDYYQKVDFCGQCFYDGINYDDKTVNCVCEIDENMEHKFIDKEFMQDLTIEFKHMFISETFYVVRCYKLVFNKNYFKKNIGCWILLFLTLIHIIIFIYFLIDDLKIIKATLKKNIKPPPNEDNYEENDENSNINKNIDLFEEKAPLNPPIRNNKYNLSDDENDNKIDTSIKNKIRKLTTHTTTHNSIIERNFHHKLTHSYSNNSLVNSKINYQKSKSKFHKIEINKLKNFDQHITLTNTDVNLNTNSDKNIKKVEKIDCDYDVLCFEEAEKYDHRSTSAFYWDYLSDKQNIINIIIDNSILDMTYLKLDRYIIAISLDFFFNALFFTDNYISKKYENNGALSFFVGLPKTIFSNIIVFFICFILDYLSSNKIEQIIKNEKYSEEFKLIAHKIMKLYKIKLVIYFILSMLIMFLSFYFVSAFCAVYHNIQNDWIISGLESCAISLIFPFLTGIIITILWKISLSYQKKNLYKVTKWLKTM